MVPISFPGCLFALCLEVWVWHSDGEDLSSSRNWKAFYLFFFCLGGTLLDVSLGLACSRLTLLPGWRLAPPSRSPDWVMMACDSDGKE